MNTRSELSKAFVVQAFFILIFMGAAIAAPPVLSPGVGQRFVPQELLVKFKPVVGVSEINALNKRHGTSVISTNPAAHLMRLRIHGNDRSVRQLISIYRKSGKVEYAEPNYIVQASVVPNDPDFSQLWALYNSGQTGGTPGADISALEAWDIQIGDGSVVVAVIDSGVDYTHQDLAANIWINPDEIPGNGIDDDGNGYIDDVRGWDFVGNDNEPLDDNSHGTHVAGTIAALGNNGIGVTGVNWNARIMPLRFLDADGRGSIYDAILALQYATAMGAKITNNSWGGSGFSQALEDAITEADAAGTLFVTAAANNGTNNDISPIYPASYDVANIIAVAATDHDQKLANFSNYGPSSVHLGAPGVNIFSTTPNDQYKHLSGTSMATPHVAGVAALLAAELPALAHVEIKQRLLDAVDPNPALKGKVITGGSLNAHRALLGYVPPASPPPSVIFKDSMENGTNGWTVSGSLWHQSNNRSVSPTTSWYYGIEEFFNYNTGGRNAGSIISPPIDLTGFVDATLSFSHFLDTEESSSYDKAFVGISMDGGITFTDIFTRVTSNGVYVEQSLNIAAFDGKVIQIRFSFDTVDGTLNNYEGWYVDDVMVTGQVAGPAANLSPTADAGLDQIVADADGNGVEFVTLNGLASFDPDGTIAGYEWRSGGTVLGVTDIVTAGFATGSHTVTLTVTDDMGATDSGDVVITVNANLPPVANAGLDQTVTDNDVDGVETVTLNGTGSFDSDGVIVSYEWKEGGTMLGSTASISGIFAVGSHTVTLTVTDNGGAVDTSTVLINVNAAPPPADSIIHVSNIDIALYKRGSKYVAKGVVSIVDAAGKTVPNVTVTGEWILNGVFFGQVNGTTSKKGVTSLNTGREILQPGDTLTITITNVFLDEFTYDSTQNVETSDVVVVP